MTSQFQHYPMDIILFLLWSIVLLPVVLLDIGDILRIILGLPFIFFIPGYFLIFILFPTQYEFKGITGLERIGLSFGFSIAIVSLLGVVLNFTPWGIDIVSVLFSLFLLIVGFGCIAFYQWRTTIPEKRFTISVDFSTFTSSSNKEKAITILLAFSILVALSSVVYIIVQPKVTERFTTFYMLTSDGKTTNFPQDILTGQNTSIILGLINHEHKPMNYTIEVWLIDETIRFNQTTQKNDTIYNHAWFMDDIIVSLNHTEITNDKNQTKKWENPYTFRINTIGYYKVAFLLFTTPSEPYDPLQDYHDSIGQNIKNAYRELHLWFYVG